METKENWKKPFKELSDVNKSLVKLQMEIQNEHFGANWKSPEDFWN